jgi:S1-C subfamily serine protease
MRQILPAFFLIALLGGCRTVPDGAGGGSIEAGQYRPLKEIILEDIQEMIEKEELFTAYQAIDTLQREKNGARISAEQLSTLRVTAVRKMAEQFHRMVEQKSYRDAYRYFFSLQQVAPEELSAEWTSRRLLREIFLQYESAGDLPLAYLLALRLLSTGSPDESAEEAAQAYQDALKLAAGVDNVAVVRELVQQMEKKSHPIPEQYRGGLPNIPPVEKILGATVTVWVDRGIRIERGVGYPDRVIGSGFFIDPRGYVLTNYHVVSSEVDPKYEGYSRLYIRLSKNATEKIPARVVGYDRIFDIALLKAEVKPDFVLSASTGTPVKPGGAIIAIGSPGGLENTVTSGIVSAVGRRFLQMGDAIQVDVPLNPGNSGGPLLNPDGQLIGIVFAGVEQFEGVNFAVPFHWVNQILPGLYRQNEVEHSWLGLSVQESGGQLKVTYVVPGEAADRAGIREADVLESLNGVRHTTIRDIHEALLDLDHPALVSVAWKRGTEAFRGVLALSARPFSPIEVALKRDSRDNLFLPLFGMKIEKAGSFLWSTNYVVKQVLQGSVADETGLSENDPLSIQGWKVDEDNRFALLRLFVKRKKSGFLESTIQLAAYLETDSFL